jgi:hypothetical protein
MLGNAIATELQLLAAREHAANLAASFAASRDTDSTPENGDRTASSVLRLEQDAERGKRPRPAAA